MAGVAACPRRCSGAMYGGGSDHETRGGVGGAMESGRLGKPEVRYDCAPMRPWQQNDVVRFEVAMNHAVAMRRVQSRGHVQDDVENLLGC